MEASTWSDSTIESAVRGAFERLGYHSVRDEQMEAVRAFLKGRDVFVSLPTGSGKSLCYGCLPLAFDSLLCSSRSIVVVVSPLKALMVDQVAAFSARGLRAVYVGDEHNSDDVLEKTRSGEYSLIFMSPESMLIGCTWREMFRSETYQKHLVAVVIDEAHCVEKWGQLFRTEFSRIGEVRSLVPRHVHMMALTATAVVSTRRKVIASLNMVDVYIVSRNPRKNNITYIVKKKPDDFADILSPIVDDVLENKRKANRVIIFCRNFHDCAEIYQYFKLKLKKFLYYPFTAPALSKFRLVDMFTSITEEEVKRNIIANFTAHDGLCRVVIGTIAFGMGLDSPNVRTVIHWGPSTDIESYVQESGRAGRDGHASTAIMYYKDNELSAARHVSEGMSAYLRNTNKCRKEILFRDFDQSVSQDEPLEQPICCDVCKMNEH